VRVSVCIPATRAGSLGAAIRSVQRQTWSDWEVVVLGQGDDGVEEALRSATARASGGDPRIRYLHLPRRGLSRARNAALIEARGEVIAYLDDDCEADAHWLETAVTAFEADTALGLVGGSVAPSGPLGLLSSCPTLTPREALYDPAASPQRPPPGWDWMGANFAIRTAVARTVGRWDVHLGAGAEFPAGEDTDYKLRLEASGVRMLSTPRSLVLHAAGTRSGRAALRSQRSYALGNGALAAKQTLAGDPRGGLWLRQTRHGCLSGWLTSRRPHRLPVDLRRGFWFEVGYRRCLHGYQVDADGLLRRRSAGPLLLPVAGAPGALLSSADSRRLVSVLDPSHVSPDIRGLRGWLERRQARRSALVLVPDRATGIRFAGRWKLDLGRLRMAPGLQQPEPEQIRRWLASAIRFQGSRPWHAA